MRLAAVTAGAVLVLDQASKYAVVHWLNLDRTLVHHIAPPWISFRMAWNKGVNFGLFAHSAELVRWGLVALALGISLWVWLWVRRVAPRPALRLSVGLLIGGAIGNALDRVFYGAVADFLNVGFPGFNNPYSFNLADIAIFVGAAGLILLSGRDKGRSPGHGGAGEKTP